MNSLAFRDQENFIHGQQRLAAAKPLNNGIKGLAPKTPGNNGGKTFNGKFTVRNRGGDDENAVGGGKTGKPEKLKFITPVAARDRAPLGAKTTNVKAKAFQTPGPLTGGIGLQKTQRRTPSARKAKIKIHQPEAVEVEPMSKDQDDEEPEIEYCPPKPIELPDVDDNPFEFGPDHKFPQFEGANMFRGVYSFFEEERLLRQQREETEQRDKLNAQLDKELEESVEAALRFENFESLPSSELTRGETKRSTVKPLELSRRQQDLVRPASTLTSRSAVAALSKNTTPRFAAPTQSTAAKRTGVTSPTRPTPRNTPGAAASRTTLGYAAGREAASNLKQTGRTPAVASPIHVKSPEQKPDENKLSQLFLFHDDDSDDDGGLLFPKMQQGKDWLEEFDDPNFQMELPVYED